MSTPIFIAPRYIPPMRRMLEIPFNGTVTVLAPQQTIVSDLVDFDFIVRMITVDFASDHNDLVAHWFLLSHNVNIGTTAPPSDENILGRISPTGFVIGDNREKRFYPNVLYTGRKNFIKMHILNGTTYTIRAKATVLIEEVKLEEV